MPTPLVYELTLNRTELGNYDAAVALFRNRFFGREEGGTNVPQVWIEVNLQRALELARTSRCKDALAVATSLGSPMPDLVFTHDGLATWLNSARTNFMLGEVSLACGQNKEADEMFRRSAQATGASDVVWASASARKLDGYDPAQWRAGLTAALSQAESNVETGGSSGWWLYTAGVLQMALGNTQKGKVLLHRQCLHRKPECLITSAAWHLRKLHLKLNLNNFDVSQCCRCAGKPQCSRQTESPPEESAGS
jgi:hypothetical protein